MAYILVHTNPRNYSHPDANKDLSGVYKKGYIVEIRNDDRPTGKAEGLPTFVRVNVTNATKEEVEDMISTSFSETSIMQSWVRKMNWQTSAISVPLDAWNVTISTDNPGVTNKGLITRNMIENYITKWNGINIEFTNNSVTFDIAVYEAGGNDGALKSEGFWEFSEVDSLVISELSYDSETGEHRISVDYSALNIKPKTAEFRVIENRGDVVSHDEENSIIVFDINRIDVLNEFKEEVRQAAETVVSRRQFKFSESDVDTVIGNGGVQNLTLAQLENYIQNMLNENL